MKRKIDRFPLRLALAMAAAAVALCPRLVLADSMCTVTSNAGCLDNGCKKAGGICRPSDLVNGRYTDCECIIPPPPGKDTKGSSAEIGAGSTLVYNGSTLTISGLTVGNYYSLTSNQNFAADSIVGSVVHIPALTFGGLQHYLDSTFEYDYYLFNNPGGTPLTVTKGASTVLTAPLAGLWYHAADHAWGLQLPGAAYSNTIASNFLTQMQAMDGTLDQMGQVIRPGIAVFSATDFLAGSNGFTTPFTSTGAASVLGINESTMIPEPATVALAAAGLGLLAHRRRG